MEASPPELATFLHRTRDWKSPGAVSHQSVDYRTTNLPPRWAVHAYWPLPECRYCPNWAATNTPGSPVHPCHRPAEYSRTSLSTFTHNRVFLYVSGLSPYCCFMCPGFHRTAVISVLAFTELLFYSYLNNTRTGLPMELSNYPPNSEVNVKGPYM